MLRKFINSFVSILLLLPVFTGASTSFAPIDHDPPSFQKPCDMDDCDMDDCNPNMPKCPLCPSSNSSIQLVRQEVADDLPTPISSFVLFTPGTLSDQGFIKTIFHPPIYIQKPLISWIEIFPLIFFLRAGGELEGYLKRFPEELWKNLQKRFRESSSPWGWPSSYSLLLPSFPALELSSPSNRR